MPGTRRRGRNIAVATLVLVIVLSAVGYVTFRRVAPLLAGSGCEVKTGGQVYKLNAGQAGI
ncbi:MAG: hypothetical protein ABJB47_24160, partial [Actinomycetota bacterium]